MSSSAKRSIVPPFLAALLAALSIVGLLGSISSAGAAVVTDRPLLFSFDGSDTTAGAFLDQRHLDVDQATGDVYVADYARQVIDKFNAAGVPQNFSAFGESSLNFALPGDIVKVVNGIAVDNSNVNPGRIYLSSSNGGSRLVAFAPAGDRLWELENGPLISDSPCDVAVDTTGHLWLGDRGAGKVREFASTGSPPAQISSFVPNGAPCGLDLDASGNVYLVRGSDGRVDKYVGGVFNSTLDSIGSNAVAVNQSTTLPSPGLAGHIFTVHAGLAESFSEYDSSGALVGNFGKGVIGNAFGVAYNHTLDRVYVADYSGHLVDAFGPAITGTVPDASIEAPTEVGISKARFNGAVNPQGVPNSYFFEWKQGPASTEWGGGANRSTPQPLAEDSSDHPVSFDASHLTGDRTYQVRLVVLNTANGLRAVSSPETFKTVKAPAAPVVSPVDATSVASTSAQLDVTIDPQQDFGTTYRFEMSTDPKCESGFSDRPSRDLESETSAAVSEEVTGLVPAQHYCARARAANSFGTTTSEAGEFTTKAIPVDEISTAYAAPRLDTSARLNARVNPEGAPLSYRFEYSEDGVTWTLLPEREDTSKARDQIVIAEELGGLEPGTTYHYRLALVENEAGASASLGEAKDFTTRTAAEVHPPSPCPNEDERKAQHTDAYLGDCRGIELVNSPDKGNQHARSEVLLHTSPLSVDGERAVWNVLSGAPGGNTGTGATFLAERTGPSEAAPNGWHSRSILPPAEQQFKNGEGGGYLLHTSTPDLSAFLFNAGFGALSKGKALIRVDAHQHQTVLKDFSEELFQGGADLTDDGAHVLFIDHGGLHQLEDLGSGAPETVSLMLDGSLNECGLDVSTNQSFVGGGGGVDESAAAQWRPGYHMIATTDASRVYFQAKPNGVPCASSGYALYLRNRETEETTLIDTGAAGKAPQFIRATPDGRAAYFLTYSNLDPVDVNSDPDVYRWSEEAGESACLTCVVADANLSFGGNSVLVSDDFSHVYFESSSRLVEGQGKAGEPNIYSLSDGEIHFVAATSGLGHLAQLSADGNTLLFEAQAGRPLTADEVAAGRQEVYRYDDRDGSIECVSCRRGGITENSVGSPGANAEHFFKVSADGSTVAFATAEALVALDVNRNVDIYVWRDGVRSLITDGLTTFQKGLIASPQVHAVDADGRDILFSLVDPGLTGFERDGFANFYDARIGGGFEPPSPPIHCSEDSCQGPLQAPPSPGQAASSAFSGRGNQRIGSKPRRPCAKKRGKARQRCARKHKRHSQEARANPNAGRTK